jgi:hypothetical protein
MNFLASAFGRDKVEEELGNVIASCLRKMKGVGTARQDQTNLVCGERRRGQAQKMLKT